MISVIYEKDDFLDFQEDFLIKENKKYVKVKNVYVQEIEKCEKLISELSICYDIIVKFRNENVSLIVKVEFYVCDVLIFNFRNSNDVLFVKIKE
ncbi:hypothetical protein ACXWQ3_09410, partial [Streptococcus pyogenes]